MKGVQGADDRREFKYQHLQLSIEKHLSGSSWNGAILTWSQDEQARNDGYGVNLPGSSARGFGRSWDDSGRPAGAGSESVGATYSYDEVTGEWDGMVKQLLGSSAGARLTTTVERDGLGRVTGYNTTNSQGEDFHYEYTYNTRHQRTSRVASNGVSWYNIQYDDRGQFKGADVSDLVVGGSQTLAYVYDGRNNRHGTGGPVTFASNGVDQVTGRELAYRGYGVHGAVGPGSTVRVFHPQAGVDGEEIYVNPETGTYGAYWTVSGSWAGAGVTRVELLVRGSKAGAGIGGTPGVADKQMWVLLPPSQETYEYDGAGRMVGDATWAYTWNGMGCLVKMERKADTAVEPNLASEVISFGYDADRRRTKKERTLTYSDSTPPRVETSKMIWSDWLPACEELSVNGGTASRRWFIWGRDVSGTWDGAGGIGGLVAIEEEGGRRLLAVDDGLGNITALINQANGETVAKFDYTPYGELKVSSGDVNACPFRYQSKYYDAETGLSYFGFRYYSAKLGRWISRDPLGEEGGFNLYGYCGNDPVNRWDYLGMDSVSELESRFFLSDGTPFASKFLILSSDQLRDKVKNAYVLSAFQQGGNILLAEQAGLAAWNSVYKPAWEAAQSDSRRAADQYNTAFDENYTPGGSFVAGLPNRLKDEGSTVVAFLGTQLLNTEAMGFRYEAGARYDGRTNSFSVAWNTADVERSDQMLAAGFMFLGGFGDDFLRGARIGWATRSSEWVDDAMDAARWARRSAPVRPSQVMLNNVVGNEWDDYVAATKLRLLDEAGLLGRQERLLTPDIIGRSYVKPDFTIWNSRGTVAAYGDAKVLQDGIVKFDAQAKGLVEWAATTESKKLIYYVPWRTQAHTNLINYARLRGVGIEFVIVP